MENYSKEQYLKGLYKETAEEFDFKNFEEYTPDKTSALGKIKSWWSNHMKISPEEMKKREAQYKNAQYKNELFENRLGDSCGNGGHYGGAGGFEGSLIIEWLRHRS